MIYSHVNQSQLKGGQRLPKKILEEVLEIASEHIKHRKKEIWVSIAFVSKREIRKLNKLYRSKDAVTDVLAFELEGEEVKGEIIISYEQARMQAKQMGHPTRSELVFLIVHGLLHVFGHDHEKQSDAAKMFALQMKILQDLGVNPQI